MFFCCLTLVTESDTADSNSELLAVYQFHCTRELGHMIIVIIDTTEGYFYIMQLLLLVVYVGAVQPVGGGGADPHVLT